jgi:hypothetical protein
MAEIQEVAQETAKTVRTMKTTSAMKATPWR